ncbi:MAG: SDR family oxidoreductase [Vicingaceae bacterium]
MNLDLSGKTALVGGSTQGIGKEVAMELAKMGATLVLAARNEEKLKACLAELDSSLGQEHTYICADFSDPQTLEKAVKNYLSNGALVNILVNNTGGPKGGPAIDAPVEEYLAAFNQHLICNQILANLLVDGMKKSKYGRIVNIISTSVKAPLKGLGVSNTVRGAVANWSKTLAGELGAFGITVNNVLPGATSTSRLDEIVTKKASDSGKSKDEIMKGMAAAVPLGRIAVPQEIAAAVAFLASPAASYISGVNLPVDGGRTPSL